MVWDRLLLRTANVYSKFYVNIQYYTKCDVKSSDLKTLTKNKSSRLVQNVEKNWSLTIK